MTKSDQYLLSNHQLFFLIGILFFSALPHFFHFPFVVTGFFIAVISFRLVFIHYASKPLSNWLIGFFLLMAFAAVAIPGNSLGTGFGVSLLIVMLGMKTLELKNVRDAYVFLFLNIFLLITLFLYNQEIYLWFYVWALVLLILGFFLSLNFKFQSNNWRLAVKPIAKMTLQALPLLIIFFIVFPRLSGPLWAFKHQTNSATTGISDSLSPGTISQLSQSSAIAFRVKFDQGQALPPPDQRYWRGPVMSETNGFEWHADRRVNQVDPFNPTGASDYRYQMTIEPTQQSWLFALEHPTLIPDSSNFTDNFSLRSTELISKRLTISLQSQSSSIIDVVNPEKIERALFVPDIVTDRMSEFVDNLRLKSASNTEYIENILKHFNQDAFTYTLSPPLLKNNPTDEFLFDTQQGFCEHYATSFVILMRLADIPARVVTGYQGGEWNPTGEHLIIRQSDAHAWAEVWLKNRGWVRIDPTTAVAPERIRSSINNTVSTTGAPITFSLNNDSVISQFMQEARWLMDTVDLNWHRWIVRFSDKKQKDLFSFAGLKGLSEYLIISLAIIISFIFVIFLSYLLRGRTSINKDPAKKLWDKFLSKLQKQNIRIAVTDGPLSIQKQLHSQLKSKSCEIDEIVTIYIALRYQPSPVKQDLQRFKQLIQSF